MADRFRCAVAGAGRKSDFTFCFLLLLLWELPRGSAVDLKTAPEPDHLEPETEAVKWTASFISSV